ncbi:MAG: substrate-binding domain-containing protein [Lentisphaeraceae bacterium]|nr:substrate-binding domain-containing protein [Lentisphaeraceae bacterium]
MIKNLAIIALAALTTLTGCGDKSSQSSSDGKSGSVKKIAVVPKAYDVDFWKVVHGGAAKAAVENKDYEVVWQPPSVNGDSSSQKSTLETLTASGYDAIAVAPIDASELVKTVASAKKRGVKMLVWDSGLAKDDSIETFIATDNYQGGVLCGHSLAKSLGEKGTVIMLRYVEGSASTTKREQGFLDTIKKYEGITYKEINQRGGNDEATAKTASETILQSNKDSIDGVFCPNQTTTEGMLLALKQLKLNGKIKLVGFDFNSAIADAIKSGDLYGTAAQNPFRMGYLAVTKAIETLEGKTIDKRVDTGVTIVTKDNIDSAEMKEILFPNYEKWISESEK